MKKAYNVSKKCVNLPKILAVFIYSFIQTYIYLYSIYNSNQQVKKESLSETSQHLQQKSSQLKKLKETNRFSIAIKSYFYIFRIITTVFILTMSLFCKIIKTKLVSGLHIPSSVVKYIHKMLVFLKPFLTTLYIKILKAIYNKNLEN